MTWKRGWRLLKTHSWFRYSIERVFCDRRSLEIFDSIVQDSVQRKLATERDLELVRNRIHHGSAILFLVDDGATVVVLSMAGASTSCIELVYRRYLTQSETLPFVVKSLLQVGRAIGIERYVFRTQRRGLVRYLQRFYPCEPYGKQGKFFEILI